MKPDQKWIKALKRYKQIDPDFVPLRPPIRSILDVFGIPLSTAKPGLILRLKKRKLLK